MAGLSEWKKPSDVMKIHRRRKSVSQKRITATPENRTTVIFKSPSKSLKRRNPFSVSDSGDNPSKRQHVDAVQTEVMEADRDLLRVLSRHGNEPVTQQAVQKPITRNISTEDIQEEIQPLQRSVLSPSNMSPSKEKPKSPERDQVKSTDRPHVPIDWSIKSKLRVVSSRPLQWCTQLKSTDEAQGVSSFVCADEAKVETLTEQKKFFQHCCMYWEHPNLPWIRLFPRIIDDSKISSHGSYLLQDEIQKPLQSNWEQSFTSAYHQLRSRLCPYFYLCTHQFTVMFYNHSGSQPDIVAMVTPTTRGFREALENEGISFKLPVCNKTISQDVPERDGQEAVPSEEADEVDNKKRLEDTEEDDDHDLLETDDAASGWLESIGLDKKAFPSLDPRKVKMQREGFRVIDNRPESLVFVQGPDVQALFNFLLNCRTCTATSGAQAGIPPTILSPSPFKGASLKSHKVKHSSVKQCDKEGRITHAHIIEVTGPILPTHSRALTTLFHHTQAADFGMVYSNHDPTTPFNVLPKVMKDCSCKQCGSNTCHGNEKCKLTKIGSDSSDTLLLEIDKFFKDVEISDRLCSIREIVCSPLGFTWNTS